MTTLWVVLPFFAALPLGAQRILGEFTGVVVDSSQAAVSGAKVTATDPATKRTYAAEANAEGVYRLGSPPPRALSTPSPSSKTASKPLSANG